MILIVNLNLAVDHLIEVAGLRAGSVHRATASHRRAGGKGVNVARVLKALAEQAVVVGFLGGASGEFIREELDREEIDCRSTRTRQESRTCVILHDEERRSQTVVNEPGPEVSAEELAALVESYERLLPDSALVCITGSLPRGLAADIYVRFISAAVRLDKRVLLDTSAEALRHGLRARPLIAKINHSEASELLARSVEDESEAVEAADELRSSGAKHAMITLGQRGALFVYDGVRYRLSAPKVEAANSVGSGDAVLAGLAAGLRRGWAAADVGALGVAAGAANALHGVGRCTAEEISRLLPLVGCRILDVRGTG